MVDLRIIQLSRDEILCTDLRKKRKICFAPGGFYLPARFNVVWPEGDSSTVAKPQAPKLIITVQVGFILLVTSIWSLRGALACKNLKLKFDMRKIMERKYSLVRLVWPNTEELISRPFLGL